MDDAAAAAPYIPKWRRKTLAPAGA